MSDIAKIITFIGLSGAGASMLGFVDTSAVDFQNWKNFTISDVKIKGTEQVVGEMKEAYNYANKHGLSEVKRIMEMVKNAQK